LAQEENGLHRRQARAGKCIAIVRCVESSMRVAAGQDGKQAVDF
jgi:hypothetical protein